MNVRKDHAKRALRSAAIRNARVTTGHAAKKTPAQLDREIATALLRQARLDPSLGDPARDYLLERGFSRDRADKALRPYSAPRKPLTRRELNKLVPGLEWESDPDTLDGFVALSPDAMTARRIGKDLRQHRIIVSDARDSDGAYWIYAVADVNA